MTAFPVWHGAKHETASAMEALASQGSTAAGIAVRANNGLVPISGRNPIEAVAALLAVRAAAGIAVITDDRWSPDRRADALRHAEAVRKPSVRYTIEPGSPSHAGPSWATFTSGSSGTPRLLLRTARSWADSFPAVTALLGLESDEILLLTSPLASSLSLFSVAHSAATGTGLRFPAGAALVDADLADVAAAHTTPHGLGAIVELIEGGARHRLRTVLVGGADLDASLRFRAEAQGIHVVEYYGAAELSFVALDEDGRGFRPFPGVEMRVDDGELWVRSPYLAAGYVGAEGGAFRRDAHGWATVGDLVTSLDPQATALSDARLRFRGRRDGAILTASATVIPEDVEAALRAIDGVEDAVAFEVPHPVAGSLVGATVQLATGGPDLSGAELRARARAVLTTSHLPRRWFRSSELPRTATGKPERARIRDEALSGRTASLV